MDVFGGGKKDSEDITGTPNSQYDLVSSLHQSLQWASTLGQYIKDAQKDNDDELTNFFQQIQQQEQTRLTQAKDLLASRLSFSSPTGVQPSGSSGILGGGQQQQKERDQLYGTPS